jgi:hypothetical protein
VLYSSSLWYSTQPTPCPLSCNGVCVIILLLYLESGLPSPSQGWVCMLCCKEERRSILPTPPLLLKIEYAAYSFSSYIRWKTRSRSLPPSQGWEEKRRSMLHTSLCVSSPPYKIVCSVLLLVLYLASRLSPPLQGWRVSCVFHHKEEMRWTLSTPLLLPEIESMAYSLSSSL